MSSPPTATSPSSRALDRDVPAADPAVRAAALDRLASRAIPPGAAGGIGELAVRLAASSGVCPPRPPRRATLLIAAADHGVHAAGVTPWPQPLTAVLAGTLADGGGAAAVLARAAGVDVEVLDVGLAGAVRSGAPILHQRVRSGTRDLRHGDAATATEVRAAAAAGAAAADAALQAGSDALLLGDVGLANTTASAALVAACTGAPVDALVGRGSGIDDATLQRKRDVVVAALARHHDQHGADADAWTILASLGGLEHAALVGATLAAASARRPVVLDGVVTDAAALLAARAVPTVVGHLVAGHRSTEPAATAALDALALRPLLDLDLRIGEGTGAVLAWPLLAQAAALLADTAPLDGVLAALPEPPPATSHPTGGPA